MKFIAERLRLTLARCGRGPRDMTLLAKRFDTALNNMPHGLCMFDAERHIVVANKGSIEHLGLAAGHRAERLHAPSSWRPSRSAAGSSRTEARAAGRVSSTPACCGAESHGVDVGHGKRHERWNSACSRWKAAAWCLVGEDVTERKIARGQDQSSGPLRLAHRPAQPHHPARPHGAGDRRVAAGQQVRHPLHRPRPVQAGQRHPRAYPRRHAAEGGRRAAAEASCATPT